MKNRILTNKTTGIATVGIATGVGAASTQYFSVPPRETVFLEKKATDVVWAFTSFPSSADDGEVDANSVAFTN